MAGPRDTRATRSVSASENESKRFSKTVANFRKTRFRGLERTQMASYLVGAAYNLLRMAKLLIAATA